MKLKNIHKFSILLILIFISLPLVYKLVVFSISLYWNYNPDHIHIDDKEWKKVFSFTTLKNKIDVDIYGRKGTSDSISDVVIVRTGILPFGGRLISPIYRKKNHWSALTGNRTTMFDPISEYLSELRLTPLNYADKNKHNYIPSIYLRVMFTVDSDSISFVMIQYCQCDEIPMNTNFYERWKNGEKVELKFINANNCIVYKEYKDVFRFGRENE